MISDKILYHRLRHIAAKLMHERRCTTMKTLGRRQWATTQEITYVDLKQQWERQRNRCVACGGFLAFEDSALDHNHLSGEVRGFVHSGCNSAEGFLKTLSDEEFEHWVRWMHRIREGGTTEC